MIPGDADDPGEGGMNPTKHGFQFDGFADTHQTLRPLQDGIGQGHERYHGQHHDRDVEGEKSTVLRPLADGIDAVGRLPWGIEWHVSRRLALFGFGDEYLGDHQRSRGAHE